MAAAGAAGDTAGLRPGCGPAPAELLGTWSEVEKGARALHPPDADMPHLLRAIKMLRKKGILAPYIRFGVYSAEPLSEEDLWQSALRNSERDGNRLAALYCVEWDRIVYRAKGELRGFCLDLAALAAFAPGEEE
jgi:hypothetical protein